VEHVLEEDHQRTDERPDHEEDRQRVPVVLDEDPDFLDRREQRRVVVVGQRQLAAEQDEQRRREEPEADRPG
jgi:hypothetical protein